MKRKELYLDTACKQFKFTLTILVAGNVFSLVYAHLSLHLPPITDHPSPPKMPAPLSIFLQSSSWSCLMPDLPLEQGLANHNLWANFGLQPVFVNKVFWYTGTITCLGIIVY